MTSLFAARWHQAQRRLHFGVRPTCHTSGGAFLLVRSLHAKCPTRNGPVFYGWAVTELAQQEPDPDVLGIMLTSMADFRAPGNARAETAVCLRSLLEAGKPPRDHVIQAL